MTIIEKFVAFAEALPQIRRAEIEAALAVMMDSNAEAYDFTAPELAELDRRVAEDSPTFAQAQDIDRLLRRNH